MIVKLVNMNPCYTSFAAAMLYSIFIRRDRRTPDNKHKKQNQNNEHYKTEKKKNYFTPQS